MGVYLNDVDTAEFVDLHCVEATPVDLLNPPTGMVGLARLPTPGGDRLLVLWHKREAERLQPRPDLAHCRWYLASQTEVVKALPRSTVKAMQQDVREGFVSDQFIFSATPGDSSQATEEAESA